MRESSAAAPAGAVLASGDARMGAGRVVRVPSANEAGGEIGNWADGALDGAGDIAGVGVDGAASFGDAAGS